MDKVGRPALLVIIRHAESARNKAKKGAVYFADEEARQTIKGVPEHLVPITDEGVMQAKKTGDALYKRFGAPDYVYDSGYERTVRTREEILNALPAEEREHVHVRHNFFLRERDPGYTYDMTEEEVGAAFPWLAEHWQTFGGFFSRPPGGESLADVANRVYLFLNMLFRDRAGQKIYVITHGGTLRGFRFLLERWDYETALKWPPGQRPENCGVTVYEYEREAQRLVLKEYNTVYWY